MDSSSATTLASPRMCTDLEMLAAGQDGFGMWVRIKIQYYPWVLLFIKAIP
jgi:hypothetical protein